MVNVQTVSMAACFCYTKTKASRAEHRAQQPPKTHNKCSEECSNWQNREILNKEHLWPIDTQKKK